MKYGSPKRKYSETVRQFCMGLDYLSPAAYRYVRRVFNKHLPDPYTLRRWYKSIDVEPGITTVSLNILKEKAEEYKNEGRTLTLALLCDEVSVKKSIEFNEATSKFTGFVSCENRSKSNPNKTDKNTKKGNRLDVAKDALVFMCVGEDFKIAVAYFFLNGLEAEERAALTQEVIRNVNETGAKVMSLTADGTITNIACVKLLGVNFKKDQPFFKSPTSPHYNIYFLLDAPHMLKLARGCFGTHKLYYKDKPISWSYVKELHDMQKIRNFNLGNKLTNLHIDYHLKPMNVRLAAEVMSNSTANGIDTLREDKYEKFQNSYETTEFIRHVNNVFDIGNVRANCPNSGYKQPICESNSEELFKYFQKAKEYFMSIEIDEENSQSKKVMRKLAIQSRSMTPFLGMVHNLTALQGLFNDYVVSGQFKEIYSFKFSQDHLETWFSCVRRGLGSNDNPSAAEFKRLYRKLLVCNEIVYDGNKANCITNETGILTVSSAVLRPIRDQNSNRAHEVVEIDFSYYDTINEELEKFDEHLNAYAAFRLEAKMKRKIKKRGVCKDCADVFFENAKVEDSFVKRKILKDYPYENEEVDADLIKSLQPCKSTVDLIVVVNKILQILPQKEFNIESISTIVMNHLDFNSLYAKTDFEKHAGAETQMNHHDQISHKTHFLSNMVVYYIHIKAHKIGGKIADEERGVYIRHTNKKSIHTSGQ